MSSSPCAAIFAIFDSKGRGFVLIQDVWNLFVLHICGPAFILTPLHATQLGLLLFRDQTGALWLLLGGRGGRWFWSQSQPVFVKVTCRWLAKITAFSKLFGIDRWGEIEAPGVVPPVILPVNKTFGSLPDSRTWMTQNHVEDLFHLKIVSKL